VNLMTGFSTLPLQVASFVGFGLFVFGICVLAYVIGTFLIRGSAVPGFAFLASLVAMFSGAQMFALGIFGEYLARIHFRTMDRPAYVVGERTDAPSEGKANV
jgi:undecaprenyl-phosphate 4-deoxy-4-formamido-L-arabinose transferase